MDWCAKKGGRFCPSVSCISSLKKTMNALVADCTHQFLEATYQSVDYHSSAVILCGGTGFSQLLNIVTIDCGTQYISNQFTVRWKSLLKSGILFNLSKYMSFLNEYNHQIHLDTALPGAGLPKKSGALLISQGCEVPRDWAAIWSHKCWARALPFGQQILGM